MSANLFEVEEATRKAEIQHARVKQELRRAVHDRRVLLTKSGISVACLTYAALICSLRTAWRKIGIWPLSLMIVGPFAGAGCGFVISLSVAESTVALALGSTVGAAIGFFLCGHVLFIPDERTLDQYQSSQLKRRLDYSSRVETQNEIIEQHRVRLSENEVALGRLRDALRDAREQHAHAELIRSRQYRLEQLFNRDWKAMRSVEFEDFLRDVFLTMGASVETTDTTGDQGVDLVVLKGRWRIAIQVKGYFSSVSNTAVQEAFAGMAHYRCNGCAVITNSRFTNSAKELANSVGCRLIHEDNMRDFILRELFDQLFPDPVTQ